MIAFRACSLALLLALALPVAAQEHRHDSEQALKALFAALNVREGAVVADVGAGSGDYSIPLAKAVGPRGRVLAVDINAKVLDRLRTRASRDGLSNVEAVQGDVDNPKLAADSVDAVLIVNAYHEMTEYRAMLAHIRTALKADGRLVIADFASPSRRTAARDVQTARHEIAPEIVLQEIRAAGFRVVGLEDPFTASRHSEGNHVEWVLTAAPAPVPAPSTSAATPAPTPETRSATDLSSPDLRIAFDEFLRLYREDRIIVLDVRDAAVFGRGRIPKARLAPMSALRDLVPELSAATQLVVTYCECPAEETSARAAAYLRQRGVKNVKALLGGWEQWIASGGAIEK